MGRNQSLCHTREVRKNLFTFFRAKDPLISHGEFRRPTFDNTLAFPFFFWEGKRSDDGLVPPFHYHRRLFSCRIFSRQSIGDIFAFDKNSPRGMSSMHGLQTSEKSAQKIVANLASASLFSLCVASILMHHQQDLSPERESIHFQEIAVTLQKFTT